jgi:hypothetical protein
MGDIQEYPQVNFLLPEINPMYPMNTNSKKRHYRWWEPQAFTASNLMLAGPADPGALQSAGGLITGRLIGNFLFTRTDTPGTGGKVGGYINNEGLLDYPTENHEPRYEYLPDGKNGLLLEGSNTTTPNRLYNTANWSTQGAFGWTANQMTGLGTLAATGPDGTTSAVVLTTTASSGHVHQTRGAVGIGTRHFTVWLRTPTGAGSTSVDLTLNNFSSHTTVTVTETWQRFYMTLASGSVTAGIRAHGQGTVIHAYGPMLTVNQFPCSEAINNDVNATGGLERISTSIMGCTGGMFVVFDIFRRSRPHLGSPHILVDITGEAGVTTLYTGFSITGRSPGNFYMYADDGVDYFENTVSVWWTERIKIAVALKPGLMRAFVTGIPTSFDLDSFVGYPGSGNLVMDVIGDQIMVNSVMVYPYFPTDEILESHTFIEGFDSGQPPEPEL